MLRSLVGSEMCIRDSINAEYGGLTKHKMAALPNHMTDDEIQSLKPLLEGNGSKFFTRTKSSVSHVKDVRQALDHSAPGGVAPFRFVDVLWTDPKFKPDRVEEKAVTEQLCKMLDLRIKYSYTRETTARLDAGLMELSRSLIQSNYELPAAVYANAAQFDGCKMEFRHGVAVVTDRDGQVRVESTIPSYQEFETDLRWTWNFVEDAKAKSVINQRLDMLEKNFEWHAMLNASTERSDTRDDKQDLFSVMKVDNHIHAASAMTEVDERNLLREHAARDWDKVVLEDGTTMGQLFMKHNISKEEIVHITADKLSHSADTSMFCRFDNFNDSYNPMGDDSIRTVFMKTSNFVKGKYFAASMKNQVYSKIDLLGTNNIHTAMEPRLSIYGRAYNEWEMLAEWWVDNQLAHVKSVRWSIQLPRLYGLWRALNKVASFGEYLLNVFGPLFEATLHPDQHPKLALFLCHVGFLDSVDDESKTAEDSLLFRESAPTTFPDELTEKLNPPYSYYMYYCAANLAGLNRLREKLHLNTIPYKPHCGESGNIHHLSLIHI
eukprot:TRINITY_DN4719_c0_g2_i12.p1 TRINITY_DN4719_c0_g2~~TRINITY_DN4719_c0_g2_i12.p1  ORF type:complete len:548 (+),score=138.95 TRINITY_DN4719_c0_g2_i12:156-1799(+)